MHNNTNRSVLLFGYSRGAMRAKDQITNAYVESNLCHFIEQPNQPKPPRSKSSYR